MQKHEKWMPIEKYDDFVSDLNKRAETKEQQQSGAKLEVKNEISTEDAGMIKNAVNLPATVRELMDINQDGELTALLFGSLNKGDVFKVGETDAPRRLDGGEFLVIGILALDAQREVVGPQMRVFQDEDRLSRGGRILLVRRDEGYGRPELQERRHDVEPRQQGLVRVPLY